MTTDLSELHEESYSGVPEVVAINSSNLPAVRVPQPTYVLRRKVYLPHYTAPEMWVAHGGEVRSTQCLEAIGARRAYALLWERPWTSELARQE
jgi:hypothetical protein